MSPRMWGAQRAPDRGSSIRKADRAKHLCTGMVVRKYWSSLRASCCSAPSALGPRGVSARRGFQWRSTGEVARKQPPKSGARLLRSSAPKRFSRGFGRNSIPSARIRLRRSFGFEGRGLARDPGFVANECAIGVRAARRNAASSQATAQVASVVFQIRAWCAHFGAKFPTTIAPGFGPLLLDPPVDLPGPRVDTQLVPNRCLRMRTHAHVVTEAGKVCAFALVGLHRPRG